MDLSILKRTKVKVRMHRREFQRVDGVKAGSSVICDQGILWVTQPHDRRDYILLPGDQLVIKHSGKVLIEAMRDADLHLA